MGQDPFLSPLLDNLNTAVMVVDEQLRIRCLNTSAENVFATSRERVLHTSLANLFGEGSATVGELQAAVVQAAQFTKREVSWELVNGQRVTVDFSVSPYVGPQQEAGLIIEIQPLDRLLRISRGENHLINQEATRSLIRGLAHEIKNPLGGIRGAAQLLARELSDPQFDEFTEVIIGEADRLRNLVDKMLGPHQPLSYQPLNIHEVLERIASIVTVETDGDIALERDYDPSIPDFMGDKEQMIQALLNVVRNAMQSLQEASTENACIRLKTRVQRQFTIGRQHHPLVCKITIIDNGPGIPSEMLDSIFYPMISGRAAGTGLGLAIAQQLINQHRGIIECESQPQNTEFTVYLPISDIASDTDTPYGNH